MYYDHPMLKSAYISHDFSQYMFGNHIIIRPVTTGSGDGGQFHLTKASIWIPPNDDNNDGRYELHSGKYYQNNGFI